MILCRGIGTLFCECGYDKLYDLILSQLQDKGWAPYQINCPNCSATIKVQKEILLQNTVASVVARIERA